MIIGYRKSLNPKKAIDDLFFSEAILKNYSLKNAFVMPDKFSDSIMKSLEEASIKIQYLEELIKILLNNKLTKKQIKLLNRIKDKEGILYYQLIEKLSKELSIPTSTVKWNLNKLRNLGIIITGDKNNKGVPVKITSKGKILLKIFNEKLFDF